MSSDLQEAEFTIGCSDVPPLKPLPRREVDLSAVRSKMRAEWTVRQTTESEPSKTRSWDDVPGVTGARSPIFMMMALAAALAASDPIDGGPSNLAAASTSTETTFVV
ncbi:MAG: hypothetical protein ACFB0F_03155 [Neomegalonema sp.]